MTWADSVLGWLSSGAAITASGFAVELALRMWPTKMPLSLLSVVKYSGDSVAKIWGFVSQNILSPLIQAGNNVKPS